MVTMTSTELRLGNIIDIKFDDGKEGYWSWSYVKVNDLASMEVFPDIYRPIPLTKEWLIKFGFTFHPQYEDNRWYIDDEIFELEQTDGGFIHYYGCNGNQIKYIHELQNIYFALTGTELCLSQKNH